MASMEGNGGGLMVVVSELSHIQDLVRQLEVHLQGPASHGDLCKSLASQIFSLTEKSIGMVRLAHSDDRNRPAAELPASGTPSPLSDVFDMPFKTNKKRKAAEKRKHQIRVSSVGGLESPVDDGYSWRKYGQKEILGAKHPRGYYRCTHRNSQGCTATKQVQRTDGDPAVFDVVYLGTHTCVHRARAMPGQAAKKQQPVNPHAQSLLQSLSSSLTVKTEGLAMDDQGWRAVPFSFTSTPVSDLAPPETNPFSLPSTPDNRLAQGVSPSLASSAASESNFLCMSGYGDWRSEADIQEVVSALVTVSSVPAPAMDTELLPDYFEFDPSFDLDPCSFFS